MKRLFLAVLLLLSMAGLANAAPFLTCDCSVATDNVTGAKLQFGTAAWVDVPVASACGTTVTCTGTAKTICYDLVSLPSGPFTVKARFANVWGESPDSVPFSGTKGLPGSPGSIRLTQ